MGIIKMATVKDRMCKELERLRKYEEIGIKCNRGHVNGLPITLWDCPICTEKLRKEREWISVKDRLPEEDSTVLIYTDHETVLMGTFTWEKKFEVGNFSDYYDTWKLEDVTHWMPLPQAPKEGE